MEIFHDSTCEWMNKWNRKKAGRWLSAAVVGIRQSKNGRAVERNSNGNVARVHLFIFSPAVANTWLLLLCLWREHWLHTDLRHPLPYALWTNRNRSTRKVMAVIVSFSRTGIFWIAHNEKREQVREIDFWKARDENEKTKRIKKMRNVENDSQPW